MADLAIKGHKERGEEVIKILEMLGGNNKYAYVADSDCFVFYIGNETGNIYYDWVHSCYEDEGTLVFTLEEFLEKFPYKVGDKVLYKRYNVYSSIKKMTWNEEKGQVIYRLDSQKLWVATADELEKRTIKTMTIEDFKANSKEWLIDTLESMSKDDALQTICDLHDELHKPQFPTTYEECCKVLNIIPNNKLVFSNPNEESEYAYRNLALYNTFDRLKVCRDAYWKIDGNPTKIEEGKTHCLYYNRFLDTIEKANGIFDSNVILDFCTKEARDTFFDNFKELIEECKELL